MKNALYFGGQKTERAEFLRRAKCFASIFADYGVGADDTIAVLLRNDTVYMEIVEACRYVGAYFVTLNWHGTAAETIDILDDSKAKLLIGHSDLTAKFTDDAALSIPILAIKTPAQLVEAYGVDSAILDGQLNIAGLLSAAKGIETEPLKTRGMLAYTSGSTGRPKGIRRHAGENDPDRYAVYKSLAVSLMHLTPGDRFYTAAPLYHSAPNALSTICLTLDFTELYIAPRFDPEGFLADIERYGITHSYLVPTMMVRLLKLPEETRNKYDVSRINNDRKNIRFPS